MAEISKITLPNGTNYDLKDTTARNSIPAVATISPKMDGTAAVGTSTKYAREDHVHPSDTTKYSQPYYQNGTVDIGMRPMVAFARANRLAFLPADQIIIEQTTDGGTTWTSAGYSDSVKKALFANRGANISIPLLNGAKSTQCGIRITITAMKYNVPVGTAETGKYNYWNSAYVNSQERYTNLREMWFWISANNDRMRVQVYRATGLDPNNWVSVFNTDFGLSGWSGSDWIRWSSSYTFGGAVSQTSNDWNWRIIFWSRMVDGATSWGSATPQSIIGISGYGDSVWGAPNPLMKEDHLYTWDVDQNATFPARVSATSFSGNLNGSATSLATARTIQTNLASTSSASFNGTANVTPGITGTLGVANGGTGQTTATNAANAFMNALGTGSSTPQDNDYYISQYVGGGTTTTTYHRRPMSTLWEYIRGKISSVLGLTASSYSGSAAKVNNHTVGTDVPTNAVFTDTTYTGTSPITVSGTAISLSNSGVTAGSKGDTANQTPTWGGTFKVPSGTVTEKGLLTAFSDHTVTIPSAVATTSSAGLMSAADKTTINDINTIYATKTESLNHVVVSNTQPSNQSAGDIWVVVANR